MCIRDSPASFLYKRHVVTLNQVSPVDDTLVHIVARILSIRISWVGLFSFAIILHLFHCYLLSETHFSVSLYFDNASEEGNYGINEAAVRHYTAQARAISKKLKLKGDVPLASLLSLPGVIKREEITEDIDTLWTLARQALLAAIGDFTRMRDKEGASIVADIRTHVAQLALHHSMIQTMSPDILKAGVQKYKDRITKLLEQANISAPLNPDVLERETVLQTDRTDISEELARLQSHFEQIEGTLKGGGETGKKLDFMTQELFRETNTIGSKCSDERITHRVVEMKGLIEKIREQVQNLE